MAIELDNPLPSFVGTNGQPLTGGYVYFGEPDKDPRSYPVDVFYDQALTIEAIQPVRTIAGYISRNGAPARMWAASECSILVLDAKRRQVFYTARVGAQDSATVADYAGLIAYRGSATSIYVTGYLVTKTPSGVAGTFVRDVTVSSSDGGTTFVDDLGRGWRRQYEGRAKVEWWEVAGDGSTDDTAALNTATAAGLPLQLADRTYVVKGTWALSSSDGSPNLASFCGTGPGTTVSFKDGGKLSINKSTLATFLLSDINFISDGNAATVVELHAARAHALRCSFTGFATALTVSEAYQLIEACVFRSNTIGIAKGTSYYNSNQIIGCMFSSNGTGIQLEDTVNSVGLTNVYLNNVRIQGNTFENNGKAMRLYNAQNFVICSNWCEAATAPINGVEAEQCFNLSVDDIWSQYTATYALSLNGGTCLVGTFRGTQFTLSNGAKLYFTKPLSGQTPSITKDASSYVFYPNLRVNGTETPYAVTRITVNQTPTFQTHGTSSEDTSMLTVRWSYDGVPPAHYLGSSAGGAVGTFTPLTSGNTMGAVVFAGAGSSKMIAGAQVSGAAAGTCSDSAMPAELQFWTTPDASTTLTRRVAIRKDGHLEPWVDNTYALGGASNRWSQLYAGTATINTSDERAKDDIQDIDAAVLRAWAKVRYCQFKFKDAAQKKGDGARWHFGLIAQRVKEAFESEGLDAFAYGLLCYDEWDETPAIPDVIKDGEVVIPGEPARPAGNRYGIRYEEALALECAYLRSRLANIEQQ